MMTRSFGRLAGDMRPVKLEFGVAPHAHGSVLIAFGNTRVICAATIEESVPGWMKDLGTGWLTAEYSMLPYSTLTRKQRESSRGKLDGRGIEIQRLIGRSLRAVVDLEALGARTLWVDCDVLQADGGTRTASITGACLAIALASQKLIGEGKIKKPLLRQLIAAVSLGVVDGEVLLDLDYVEDKDAEVDLNLVMTEKLEFVELQATGEETVFTSEQLSKLLDIGREGIRSLIQLQISSLEGLAREVVN